MTVMADNLLCPAAQQGAPHNTTEGEAVAAAAAAAATDSLCIVIIGWDPVGPGELPVASPSACLLLSAVRISDQITAPVARSWAQSWTTDRGAICQCGGSGVRNKAIGWAEGAVDTLCQSSVKCDRATLCFQSLLKQPLFPVPEFSQGKYMWM